MTDEFGQASAEFAGQIVPFGKYKGRPTAELLADDSYLEYMRNQPGLMQMLSERHVNFYNVVVYGGSPPQDSAEHNEMQARFLEEDWCLKLVHCLPGLADHGWESSVNDAMAWKERSEKINKNLTMEWDFASATVADVIIEDEGWDVTFNYRPADVFCTWKCTCSIEPNEKWQKEVKRYSESSYSFTTVEEAWREEKLKPKKPHDVYPDIKPPYTEYVAKQKASYEQELAEYPVKLAEYQEQRHYALGHSSNQNTWRIPAPGVIAAELKPDLGDDYPVVLRQVKKYMIKRRRANEWDTRSPFVDVPTCEVAFVVARRAQFDAVTWDQVKQIFGKSGITLVMENELLT